MLKELLRDNIFIIEEDISWQDAIKAGSVSLVKEGRINKQYVEAMINNVNKLGSYIVLADGIAMPHSRPEDGVEKTSMSLVLLKKPCILIDKEVDMLFILASQDSNSHIELITALTDLLGADEKLAEIRSFNSVEKIMEVL